MADTKTEITSIEEYVAIKREGLRGPIMLAVQKSGGSATQQPRYLVEIEYASQNVGAYFNITELRALRKWLNDNID